jgi:prepilin-type processing-associated H-X9-DG protein
LAVIGNIAVLIGFILPSLAAARAQGRAVKCLSNLRQLGLALLMYSGDNKGYFPPNTTTPAPGLSWMDPDRIGRYLPLPPVWTADSTAFSCPGDNAAATSYAMNIWASSKVDNRVTNPTPPALPTGQLWQQACRKRSGLILLGESWSGFNGPNWQAATTIGAKGSTPGQRFGASPGISYSAGRWGIVTCELDYSRHRLPATRGGLGTQPIGRTGFCFADGHVAMCRNDDLVDRSSGQSTGLAAWSPLDFVRN